MAVKVEFPEIFKNYVYIFVGFLWMCRMTPPSKNLRLCYVKINMVIFFNIHIKWDITNIVSILDLELMIVSGAFLGSFIRNSIEMIDT